MMVLNITLEEGQVRAAYLESIFQFKALWSVVKMPCSQ